MRHAAPNGTPWPALALALATAVASCTTSPAPAPPPPGTPAAGAAAARAAARASAGAPDSVRDRVYFEFQVEQPVRGAPGSVQPRYPLDLRNAGIQGEVQAQFVVDTMGRAVPGSFKVLRSSHELFTAAVRTAIDSMTFVPGRVGGRKVRQLVQQPFQFHLVR